MITIIACILLVGVFQAGQASPAFNLRLVLKEDDRVQRRIDGVVQKLALDPRSDDAILEAEQLGAFARSLREVFVQQSLLYADDPAHGQERYIPLALLDNFEISASTRILAVVPLLEDERTRNHREVQRLLRGIEGDRLDAPPDFSTYASLLQGMKEKFPDALADYMFQRAPGAALLTYMRNTTKERDAIRAVLWAEHVVDDFDWRSKNGFLDRGAAAADVTAELKVLSVHEEWWARRYVVEILKRYPKLDDGQMMEKLRTDSHALVKDAANQPASSK